MNDDICKKSEESKLENLNDALLFIIKVELVKADEKNLYHVYHHHCYYEFIYDGAYDIEHAKLMAWNHGAQQSFINYPDYLLGEISLYIKTSTALFNYE